MSEISANLVELFQKYLLAWGEDNIKDYPWRYLDDPYKILLSELMLHRTQVTQVLAIYQVIIEDYPTINDFSAEKRKILKRKLKPLGLDWRIESLIEAIIKLEKKHGEIPIDYGKLISIKGIGPYIAGAVVCFSKNERMALIDTNVLRVVSRVFEIDLSGEARKRVGTKSLIFDLCAPDRPQDFYYSIIDLAHNICRIKKPSCEICPLQSIPCKFAKKRSNNAK